MALYQIDNIPSPINWEEKDIIQRTLQNAKNLLMCQMWEVPYNRFRGMDPSIFDLPIKQLNMELIPELDRVMMLEPDVSVQDAEATLLQDGRTYIKVILDVRIPESGTA